MKRGVAFLPRRCDELEKVSRQPGMKNTGAGSIEILEHVVNRNDLESADTLHRILY